MNTRIATLRAHPTDPDVALLTTPPNDQGATMRDFGPATFSPERHAYLVPVAMLDQLRAYLRPKAVHLVDERQTRRPGSRTTGNPDGHDCQTAGCVTLADWAARHPEEAQQLRDGLDAIEARSREAKGRTP